MGLGRILAGVAGVGLAAGVAQGLGGFDDTTRDSNGSIMDSGNISVFSLQIGDCLNGGDLEKVGSEMTSVSESFGVPCTESHAYEVYGEYTITEDGAYNKSNVLATAQQYCKDSFDGFVGVSYEDSTLDISYLYPTTESWDNGDREITCLATTIDGSLIDFSLKGSQL